MVQKERVVSATKIVHRTSVHRISISSAIIRTIRVIRVPFLLPDSNTEAQPP